MDHHHCRYWSHRAALTPVLAQGSPGDTFFMMVKGHVQTHYAEEPLPEGWVAPPLDRLQGLDAQHWQQDGLSFHQQQALLPESAILHQHGPHQQQQGCSNLQHRGRQGPSSGFFVDSFAKLELDWFAFDMHWPSDAVALATFGPVLDVLPAGSAFGELAAISGDPCSVSIRCLSDCSFLCMDSADLLLVLAANEAAAAAAKMVARRKKNRAIKAEDTGGDNGDNDEPEERKKPGGSDGGGSDGNDIEGGVGVLQRVSVVVSEQRVELLASMSAFGGWSQTKLAKLAYSCREEV
jgi:CRP-like cAMP-binding protein